MRFLVAEGLYLVKSLRELGHEVLTIGRGTRCEDYDVALERPVYARDLHAILDRFGFVPDVYLWCDLSDLPFIFGFETLDAVTVGYSIDQYCHPWHFPFSAAFDLTLCAQRDYLPLFAKEKLSARYLWFPLFASPFDQDLGLTRDVPVSFVGSLHNANNPGRAAFLNEFKRHCPLLVKEGDYRRIFGRSLIALNQSAAGELNFRIFEAAACGAAVLSEDADNGLKEIFEPGRDILIYPRGDAPSAARIARQALAGGAGLKEIAARGCAKVLREHSAKTRCLSLLREVETLAKSGAAKARLSRLNQVQAALRNSCGFIAAELPPERVQHHLYLSLAGSYGLDSQTGFGETS